MDCVEGFAAINEDDEIDTRKLVSEQNRKKKKSGGFQSMGLSHVVFKGIIRKGYKVPTPIQRKCIPIILDNKDVVAMARTGSGKTACFLIPLFEKLKVRSAKAGARALILSPTRELALQTLKFTKEIGKFTGLKAAVVLGGDSLENQFSSIHENPDIIIATPGRFMHLCVEMELKLNSVEYVVFDEADRLFELGFAEQIGDILTRLPDNRQTLLFSATLPKLLVEFASAGLTDPVLIRLDVDNKLSDQLKMTFMYCRQDDKLQTLLYLLRNVIPRNQMTVLFCATKYHCEYLHMILDLAGIPNTYIYSELDQTARKINAAKFQMQKVKLLIVTDVAARGIDIPLLDNVINFHFPPKSKLYIHRVGRVARAGRSGCAYSIISPDEMAYVLDLHLFLGRPVKIYQSSDKDWDGVIGTVPRNVIDEGQESLDYWIKHNSELESQIKVNINAYKKYLTCRPPASTESIRRAKVISADTFGVHPLLSENEGKADPQREDLLSAMKQYRPKNTIFEINNHSKNPGMMMMKAKRDRHGEFIDNHWKKKVILENGNSTEINNEEGTNLAGLKFNNVQNRSSVLKNSLTQPKSEYYLSHIAPDQSTERELVIGNAFGQEASEHVLDLTGDNQAIMQKNKSQMKWDRKKKKFVESGMHNKKKIKTESGVWISASYKTNRYKQWVNKSKVEANQFSDDEDDEANQTVKQQGKKFKVLNAKNKKQLPLPPKIKCSHRKGPKHELKNIDQIIKERKKKHKRKTFHNRRKHK